MREVVNEKKSHNSRLDIFEWSLNFHPNFYYLAERKKNHLGQQTENLNAVAAAAIMCPREVYWMFVFLPDCLNLSASFLWIFFLTPIQLSIPLAAACSRKIHVNDNSKTFFNSNSIKFLCYIYFFFLLFIARVDNQIFHSHFALHLTRSKLFNTIFEYWHVYWIFSGGLKKLAFVCVCVCVRKIIGLAKHTWI